MKSFLFANCFTIIVASSVFFSSCERTETVILQYSTNKVVDTRAEIIEPIENEYEVTQRMAFSFISSNKENPPIVSVEPYQYKETTCFYVFNFENGFKVVSADTRIQPILAESKETSLDFKETDNVGLKTWLEDIADRIWVLKTYNLKTGEDYSQLWSLYRFPSIKKVDTRSYDVDSVWVLVYDTTSEYIYNNANVSPLLSTKWGQASPWNDKMPLSGGTHCLTGCVAVAASQVLYYYHSQNSIPNDLWHSISITGTPYCSDPDCPGLLVSLSKSNHTISSNRWAAMPLTKTGSNTDYVSSLMLDLGERLKMHYGTIVSNVFGASNGSIPRLNNCGIYYSFSPYSFSNVKNSIINNKPVIVGAFLAPNYGGHIWVIDGCKDYSIKYTSSLVYYCIHPDQVMFYPNAAGVLSYDEMMSLYPDASGGRYQLSYSETYDNQQSMHMNWGFDGEGDAWYNMLDSNNWICTNNGSSVNFLYDRVIHYNTSVTQLN